MTKKLTSETITAIEIMESMDTGLREKALIVLRELWEEHLIEEKWNNLLETHPEPMIELARKAKELHRQKLSKEFL